MSNVNVQLLKAIADATAANVPVYVSKADGLPLLQNVPALIEVDTSKTDPADTSKVAAKITDDGVKFLAAAPVAASAKPAINAVVATGFVRPKSRRTGGGNGAPVKYPFDGLAIGEGFFIANSEVAKGDAFKTLSSAVGSANQRYSEKTGEEKTVTRAKRGADHKTVKDATGKNVTETVTIPVTKQTRKFVVNKVEKGIAYGSFTAPDDGAFVLREEVKVEPAKTA